MKIKIPVIIKDPEVADYKGVPFWEEFLIEEDVFLDGPVSRRVAILDFDESGRMLKGTDFKPLQSNEIAGKYFFSSQNKDDFSVFQDWGFVRTAVFGGVYKALSMFEESDALGRRVRWAFSGPQLLVIPRAGEWANAFYERDSRSLQLFYISNNGKKTYACHSQDIIGHETAHAIIDGIVPDLYDAITPESLAIHEAIADITTVLLAFRSRKLTMRVLELTHGKIDDSCAFTRVAEQFAGAMSQGRHHFLRNLVNDVTMQSNGIDIMEPHDLSQILSGALYSIVIKLHEELKNIPQVINITAPLVERAEIQNIDNEITKNEISSSSRISSGKALFLAGERLKRMVLRGLDYLPPGDASFVDFGRAMLAADAASHPESSNQRDWLIDEFIKRKIISTRKEIEPDINIDSKPIAKLDLSELHESDWVAYQFANKNREWLGIPSKISFEIRPRLIVKKKYYHREGMEEEVKELILKIGWAETENMSSGPALPKKKRIRRGITLAIDFEKKKPRALLCTKRSTDQMEKRDEFIRKLVDADFIRIGEAAKGPTGSILRTYVPAEIRDKALSVKNTARMLHIIGGYDYGR